MKNEKDWENEGLLRLQRYEWEGDVGVVYKGLCDGEGI